MYTRVQGGFYRVEALMAELWALNMRGNTWLGSSMRKTVRANCHPLPLPQRMDLSLSADAAEPVNIILISVICVVAFRNLTVASFRQLFPDYHQPWMVCWLLPRPQSSRIVSA